MQKLKTLRTDISVFVAKHLNTDILLFILGSTMTFELYLKGPKFNFSGGLFLLCALLTPLLQKFKEYKFKARKNNCLEFFLLLQKKFPQYEFDNNFYLDEIFDRQQNFLYTRVLVPLYSDYREPIEDAGLYNYPVLPLHIFNKVISSKLTFKL